MIKRFASFLRRFQDEKGQAMVLLALAFAALCGMVGLTFDVGYGYMHKQNLQAAVDAGALAGASSLEQSTTQQPNAAETAAQKTAEQNVSNAYFTVSVNGSKVFVTAHQRIPTFFMKILGINYVDITASSTAKYGPIMSANKIVPIGMSETSVLSAEASPDTPVTLTTASQSAGNWGYLSLDGKGANTLGTDIQNGVSGSFDYNSTVNVLSKPGEDTGPVSSAVTYRINEDQNSTACSSYLTATMACNRVVLVPVVTGFGNGESSVTIVGFAEFYLEPYNGGVTGYFIKTVTPGEINSMTGVKDFQADAVQLVN